MKNIFLSKLVDFFSYKIKASIARKIFFGIFINIALIASLMCFTIYNIQKVYSLTNSIPKKNYKVIKSAKVIVRLLIRMAEKDEQVQYSPPEALHENSQLRKIFESNKVEIEEHLKILQTVIETPLEKKAFEEIKVKFPLFCKRFEFKIFLMKTKGEKEQTVTLLKFQNKLVDDIKNAVKLIVDENERKIEKILIELGEIESKTKYAQYSVSLFTLALLIIFGNFLYFGIKNPIMELKKGAQSISRGELGAQIEIRSSGDEFEKLAILFNKMSREIKKLDEMKSDFIYLVTHELKTPLTSIKEAISLIREGILGSTTPKQMQVLNIADDGINRLFKFIKELLDLLEIEGSLYHISRKPVDILELLSENLLHLENPIRNKKITIVKNVPVYSNPVYINSLLISRVITNLVGNAINHSPNRGKIEVGIVFCSEKKISDAVFGEIEPHVPIVEIYVKDKGPGIDSSNFKEIFSKFYQVKEANKQKDGNGLGLAIAKEIVLAHDGRIGVRSKIGEGACFFFALPINKGNV